jgi:hypothetical protein
MNYFDQIDTGLWQGAEPERSWSSYVLGPAMDLDLLVLTNVDGQDGWGRFDGRGFAVMRAPMQDDQRSLRPEDAEMAEEAAKRVCGTLQQSGRVLVTCHMGLNRSGLISGISLCLLREISGAAALQQVRSKRPGSLFNPEFAKYLAERK